MHYVILIRQENGRFQYDLATYQDGIWATFDHGNINHTSSDVIWYTRLPDRKAIVKWTNKGRHNNAAS